MHQTLQVISLELPTALPAETTTTAISSSKFVDVDGDGYAEQTQWVQANQAMLVVDLNGDGQIGMGERVNLQDAGQVEQARTSMAWLDANGDGKLTAQDPAFAALKLWIDANSDGKSASGELQSLAQANITAIDFSTNPPSIERADGSQQTLTVQTLTADTLGVALQQTAGGVVETTEQLDGTGTSVLHASNTRAFDGQAEHTQGGGQDVDGSSGDVVQVDASKLATTNGAADIHNERTNSSAKTRTCRRALTERAWYLHKSSASSSSTAQKYDSGTFKTRAKWRAINTSGVCLPRSYWLMRALAENSSTPASTPKPSCENPERSRAALSRRANKGSAGSISATEEARDMPQIV